MHKSCRYSSGTNAPAYETFNFTEGQGGEFRAARWSDAAPRACDTWQGSSVVHPVGFIRLEKFCFGAKLWCYMTRSVLHDTYTR